MTEEIVREEMLRRLQALKESVDLAIQLAKSGKYRGMGQPLNSAGMYLDRAKIDAAYLASGK